MHAVKAQSFDHKNMVFNHDRHVALVRYHPARIGGPQDVILVAAGKGKANAGNIDRVQHSGQTGRKDVKIKRRRCDQGDLRAVFGGHSGLLLSG
jgi:hypothetical protein